MTAKKIVDALTEGGLSDWVSDTTERIKDATGIGRDAFGLGTNKEKGWKPKYTAEPNKKYAHKPKPKTQPILQEPNSTWQD